MVHIFTFPAYMVSHKTQVSAFSNLNLCHTSSMYIVRIFKDNVLLNEKWAVGKNGLNPKMSKIYEFHWSKKMHFNNLEEQIFVNQNNLYSPLWAYDYSNWDPIAPYGVF